MIYLTNDVMDQAVYFDLRGSAARRLRSGMENHYYGLLGNGVNETPVTIKSRREGTEIIFGRGELFRFVEEELIRRMIGEVIHEMPPQ
ncbi:MAG TPA: hypothetical protein VHN12_05310 [Geobacteraceae bacterium]|nr:hypothetical protein [Geobacteraceae bacterium]